MRIKSSYFFAFIFFLISLIILFIFLSRMNSFDDAVGEEGSNRCQTLIKNQNITVAYPAKLCVDGAEVYDGKFSDVKNGKVCCVKFLKKKVRECVDEVENKTCMDLGYDSYGIGCNGCKKEQLCCQIMR